MPASATTTKSTTHTQTVASRAVPIDELAPADEYFGPLKLSILGIRNTIHDLGARYDVNHDIWHQTFTSAQLTERAIHDWEGRYPRDGQVPKAIYLLQRLYTKVLSQESRDRASLTAKWLLADYAATPQGKQLKKTMATEHLPPLDGATPVAAPAASAPPASSSALPAGATPPPVGTVPSGAPTGTMPVVPPPASSSTVPVAPPGGPILPSPALPSSPAAPTTPEVPAPASSPATSGATTPAVPH